MRILHFKAINLREYQNIQKRDEIYKVFVFLHAVAN